MFWGRCLTHLIFKPLPYYIATPSVSQSWCLEKNLIFPICLPVILVLNFVFHIDATIHLSCGFLSGITVWKADPRAGGWTPDRGQPAGAMQAWLGDWQHEQHQVGALRSLRLLSFELPLGRSCVCFLLNLARELGHPVRCGKERVSDLN